ncbi:MAG: prepilin peptidase, partial [Proteobacteria bacterium]|nr:prepilin peptidase [Pseudomonadota bacterium]
MVNNRLVLLTKETRGSFTRNNVSNVKLYMILEGIILLGVGGLLVWAAVSDFKSRIIPNWIPLTIFILFGGFLAIQAVSGVSEPVLPILPSLAAGFGVLVIFTILFALNMIGGGDVKLIAAISFWAGLAYVAEFLVIMALSGGVLALFYFLKNHNRVDPEVKPEVIINKSSESSATMTFGENKQTIKGTHIPY